MRKRTFIFAVNHLLWILLSILPLAVVLVYALHHGIGDIHDYLIGLEGITSSLPIYDFVNGLIGPAGYLPLVSNSMLYLIDFFTYFVCLAYIRLCIDVIIFLPSVFSSLAEKALHKLQS